MEAFANINDYLKRGENIPSYNPLKEEDNICLLYTSGKAGTLFYQVIHNRVARQINSVYKIYPDEWDIFNSQIIRN